MRRLLKRTWGPFLGRFGRPTSVQSRAIPILLDGGSVVICSPTASGKTEAAMAPLVERHAEAGCEELRILYVVPTRALVNDLQRRLEGPLRDLRLKVMGRTGDRPQLKPKDKMAVLVTTPESLDSLLGRQPERFDTVRAVVLDELHLLDGTYRGDQLRVLLRRLGGERQRVVLSATVHDPDLLAERYVAQGASVVSVGEPRALDLAVVPDAASAVALCRTEKRHKLLWFCNTRRDVESAAAELEAHWPRDRILAHHGSLSRRERLSAEEAMQTWPWGLCVATMTLEIGIDIGDVDAVVLDQPPLLPSAFQQRIGRACRREDRIFAVGLCREEGQRLDFEALAGLASEGVVEPSEAAADLSVAVQQVLSTLWAAPGGLPRAELLDRVEPLASPAALALILGHLEAELWIETARGDRLRPTTTLMDAGEKGRIHSNIPDSRERTFTDAATGRAIGTGSASVNVGDTVVLAGRARRVVGTSGGKVQLALAASGDAPAFHARRSGGAWRWLLPDELK